MDSEHADYTPKIFGGLAVFFSWLAAWLFKHRGDIARDTGKKVPLQVVLNEVKLRLEAIERRLETIESKIVAK